MNIAVHRHVEQTTGDAENRTLVRTGLSAFGAGVVQAGCVFFMAGNAAKVALGLGSAAAAGSGSLFHTAFVRIPLAVVAAAGSAFTLYVVWNGWQLRNRRAAQWRRHTLSPGERRSIRIAVLSSVLTWILILAELVTHRMLHPY